MKIARAPRAEEAREYTMRINRLRATMNAPAGRSQPRGALLVPLSVLFSGAGVALGIAAASLKCAPDAPLSLAIRVIAHMVFTGGGA